MNAKFLLVSAGMLFLTSCHDEFDIEAGDVPQPVITALSVKFPMTQEVKWEAEKVDGHLSFEANFKVDGKKKEAFFKPDGTFMKEE